MTHLWFLHPTHWTDANCNMFCKLQLVSDSLKSVLFTHTAWFAQKAMRHLEMHLFTTDWNSLFCADCFILTTRFTRYKQLQGKPSDRYRCNGFICTTVHTHDWDRMAIELTAMIVLRLTSHKQRLLIGRLLIHFASLAHVRLFFVLAAHPITAWHAFWACWTLP